MCGTPRYREWKKLVKENQHAAADKKDINCFSDDTKHQNKSLDSKQEKQCFCEKSSTSPVGVGSEYQPDKKKDTKVMQISSSKKDDHGIGNLYCIMINRKIWLT